MGEPGLWAPKAEPPRALKITHKSPTKLAEGLSAITVTFNQPMVRLGRVRSKKEDPKRFPIRVEPAVDAVYRWVAGDTLKVALGKPLQNAARYTVTLPAGLRSLAGARLVEPYAWSFETPRPEVVRWSLLPEKAVRAGRLLPKDRFVLTFNLKMDPADVKRNLTLKVNGHVRTAAVARFGKDPKRVLVRPDAPFPAGAKVLLAVGPGTHAVEGPLPSSRRFANSLSVYGPLSADVRCDDEGVRPGVACWPMRNARHEGLTIRFSELVPRDELLRHVKITPAPRNLRRNLKTDGRWCGRASKKGPCGFTWQLKEDLRPRSGYTVQLNGNMRDVFGQRLGRTVTARFATRPYPPGIFLSADKEGFREKWQPFRFKAINVRRASVELAALTGADLIRFVECLRKNQEGWKTGCPAGPATVIRTVSFSGKKDVVETRTVPIPGGLVVVKVASPEVKGPDGKPVVFQTLATETGLGLHARLSPFGISAWVTSLRAGRPVSGVEVSVSDHRGNKLWTGLSNRQGFAEASRVQLGNILKGKHGPRLYVLARKGTDHAYLTLQDPHHRFRSRWRGWRRRSVLDWFEGTYRPWADADDGDREANGGSLEPQSVHDFTAWEGDRPILAGYISTERGIYRPGHAVYVHGAVRVYRAWQGAPAAGVEATVKLLNPSNVALTERKVKLSPLGVFKLSMQLPASGRLGYHRVALWIDKKQIASHSFRVAEYRAPRFRVILMTSPRKVLPDETFKFDMSARYLFGGAMDGAAYRMSVTRRSTYFYVTGHEGYRVGGSWYVRQPEKTWLNRQGVLDKKGTVHLTVNLKDQSGHFPWPAYQVVEAEVTSAAHRSVAARSWVVQHPGEVYAAYKVVPGKGDTLYRHILLVTPKPKKWAVRSGRTVTATLFATKNYRPDWSRPLYKTSFVVPTAGYTLKVRWPKTYEGRTAVMLLSVSDPAGRQARTAEWVYRPSRYTHESDKADQDTERRDRQLKIKLDRKRYLPGQTAKVTVTRNGPLGDAVLFLERERVFQSYPLLFDRSGRATVSFIVEDRFARNVTLRAVALRSGKALRGRLGPLVTTTETLYLSDKPYHLGVELQTDRRNYRPGEKVKVKLSVRDGLKRPRRAQVVLMAVDEAVLQLTAYTLPDPLYDLLRTPLNGVLADDLRRHLAPLGIPVMHRDHTALASMSGDAAGLGGLGMGGGGLGRGAVSMKQKQRRSRKKFLTCAWHATVVTDEQGRAETGFVLPDNLTEYRIMAFAVDDSRSAGSGRTDFKVDLPLLALPALPRFVRAGDRFRGGVVLYNKGLREGRAVVTAAVSGAVRSEGSVQRTVTLGRGREAVVRFGFNAGSPGKAKLVFSVRMGTVTDRVEQTLTVHRPTFPEAVSVSGQTRGAVLQGIERLSGLRPDHGGLEVTLASTALIGVEDGMEQLIQYPYGCLEQKASRLLPMIAAAVLGERFRIRLPSDPKTLIRIGLQDILAMQRHDGGFGYWPRAYRSWPWATAYALVVMHRAKAARKATGIPLPADAVGRALRYLRPFARNPASLGFYWFPYHTFILYALSLHGEDVGKDALYAYKERHREPLFARAMLLAAMANNQKERPGIRKAIKTLTAEISDSLRIDGTWAHAEENLHDGYKVMMHSDDRSTAMVLLSLLHARPSHPMVPRLVRWFLLGRKQARFRNTQEAAWALMSLVDYARIREKVVPDFEAGVWLGRSRIVTAFFKGRTLKPHLSRLSMPDLMRVAGRAARDLVIAKRGKGTLYYVARLRYARLRLPEQPRDHGMLVTKNVSVLDKAGRPLKRQRAPHLGDVVMVTVRVKSNEARRYVVVDDPLPAGLEALDATLAVGSRSFGAAAAWRKSSWWDHRELRDDRVLFFRDYKQPGTLVFRYLARVVAPGTFLVPPSRAEEMYTPEVFGHTAATTVTFTSK